MALPNKPEFCKRECRYLNVTEAEQKDKKIAHFCRKYKRVVKHNGYEPYLVKLTECKEK
jgi:hypothetical protein